MKLIALKCPECRGEIEIEDGMTSCFCKYCGCKIMLDDERVEHTVSISKTVHHRHTDDSDVIRAKTEERESQESTKIGLIIWGVILLIAALSVWIPFMSDVINRDQGKIQAGNCDELIGQNYQSVVAHFEAAGFSNIEVIDLDDAGLAFWNNEKVATISVGGDTSFSSDDWFDPDTKVVISYH